MTKSEARRTVYFKDLQSVLDDIFDWAGRHDLSLKDMTRLSGLCYQTILNLDERITVFPTFRTVLMIARGIGYPLHFEAEVFKKPKRRKVRV